MSNEIVDKNGSRAVVAEYIAESVSALTGSQLVEAESQIVNVDRNFANTWQGVLRKQMFLDGELYSRFPRSNSIRCDREKCDVVLRGNN